MEEEAKVEPEAEGEGSSDDSDHEDLRHLILEQLASMEPSDLSDEESYQVRLSCILEDDESESSASQGRAKEFPKNGAVPQKRGERDKTSEDPPTTGESEGSESSDNIMTLRGEYDFGKCREVQVTDLDELSVKNSDADDSPSEKTEIQMKTEDKRKSAEGETEEEEEEEEEDEDEEVPREVPFGIKKLKSSDNVLEKRFVPKRTEFSSDSSDIDISISNEKPCDVTVVGSPDDTIRTSPSVAEEEVPEVDPTFPKVSRSCVEKARSREGVSESGDSDDRVGSVERELLGYQNEPSDPKMILQVVHLRSKSPRVYTPPVPPETYLWEELKRIRGKGGYPWTYLDKPPFDEAAWKKYMEHEYEPINPPPLSVLRRREEETEKDGEGETKEAERGTNESGIPETKDHSVRVPDEDVTTKKARDEGSSAGAGEEAKSAEDMEVEEIATAQDLQDEIENRYLAQSPTTTASRTDCDVNTSMLDSSGLEDIPLKRAARNKVRAQSHGIQQKLRSQAGKIKSRLKSIPKPTLGTRERPKNGAAQEKHKFRLPDRPKFSFPERAKFNLPERPKFKLPDKSKFTLPERPKFSLPERPKLNLPELHLPERPKFHMPERPKLHLPERPKFTMPERPKFHMPERPKLHLPERPKLHLPERPKINFPSFSRPLRERQESSPRKNIFELDFKSYPKIFSKKSKQHREYMTSSPKKVRGSTPPPKMRTDQPLAPERKKVPVGQRWLKKMDDIKYADDEMSGDAKDRSESMSDIRDKDLEGYMEDLDDSRFPPGGRKTLSTKSSLSHMSDRDVESLASSEGRLRKGVLEEIDSDEFFLRQKGISQEDIDMGKYLSHEIREAFRSPEVNALARMDYEYGEMDAENEPSRPTRTRSLKKTGMKKHFESDPALSENSGYKTYPPRRPNRKSRSQSKSLVNEEAVIAETVAMYANEPPAYQEDNASEYYKSPGPAKEYVHYKVPRPLSETTPVPYRRKKAGKKKFQDVTGVEASVEAIDGSVPQTLTRRKSKKKLNGQQESMDEGEARQEDDEKSREHEYIIPEGPDQVPDDVPVPPRRTRSLSRGSRSMRSSRSFRSEGLCESGDVASSMEPEFERVEAPTHTQSLTQFEVSKPHHYEAADDDPGFGYATIGKPVVTRPERQKKPQRPPPPRRRRDLSSLFHTVPRRTPVRPMRNYSTLGPSRPPRKSKVRSIERLSQAYIEIEGEGPIKPLRYEECHGSNKDLQKEEVIEKMKGRPLPPPPRPPRQKSKGPEDFPDMEDSEETKISIALLRGEPVPVEVEALVHSPPPDAEAVEEVCVSTQTDPVPDDFLLDVGEDVIQEFSHEQLRIQQAFLEEMKKGPVDESASEPPWKAEESGMTSPEEEKRVAERLEMELLEELEREARRNEKELETEMKRNEKGSDKEAKRSDKEQGRSELLEAFDADLGYASLDRRQHRQEPETSSSAAAVPPAIHIPVIPDIQTSVKVLRTDKLDVKELEVERLNVKEVHAQGINVSSLQTGQLTADEVSTRSGSLSLGSVELPPAFIQQIVEKIPWDELRQSSAPTQGEGAQPSLPTRRHLPLGGSDDGPHHSPPPRRHRKHRREASSSDEDHHEDGRPPRRHVTRAHSQSVSELSKQLATACAASGVRAIQSIASTIQNTQLQDKALLMRIILCVLVIMIAGFLMLGCDKQTVLHHHWDFQFPPQPPPHQF